MNPVLFGTFTNKIIVSAGLVPPHTSAFEIEPLPVNLLYLNTEVSILDRVISRIRFPLAKDVNLLIELSLLRFEETIKVGTKLVAKSLEEGRIPFMVLGDGLIFECPLGDGIVVYFGLESKNLLTFVSGKPILVEGDTLTLSPIFNTPIHLATYSPKVIIGKEKNKNLNFVEFDG